MEKEKLDEGRKTFQEDKDKYEKFKQDLQTKSNETEEKVREEQKEIERLLKEINNLKKEESAIVSSESKCLEDLQVYKQAKKFLDLLAISAGKKHPRPQRKHHTHTTNPPSYDIA